MQLDYSHLYNAQRASLYDASSGLFVARRTIRAPNGRVHVHAGEKYAGVQKVCDFEAYSEVGTPHMQAVDHHASKFGLLKMASAFPAAFLQRLASVEPSADRTWAVGNALGAVESWGSNKNADAFPRMGLMNADPDSYGHKTFEKHAYIYTHHDNKDPKKSIGKVAYAYWDDDMDKVLTLFYLLKDKAPHLVNRLEAGDSFPVSMGCRCDLDRCSIRGCENEAPTRAQYCEHLRDFPNQVMPDGQKVMALTPRPRFFDLSAVLRGADPIAHALTIVDPNNAAKTAWDKRARYYPMYERNAQGVLIPTSNFEQHSPYPIGVLETKTASVKAATNKRAFIKKEIPGMAEVLPPEDPRIESFAKESLPLVEASDDDIPKQLLDVLAEGHSMGEILSSFAGAGIVLKPNEFRRLALVSMGKADLADQLDDISPEEEDELLSGQNVMKQRPPMGYEQEMTPSTEKMSAQVRRKIAHLIPGRSYAPMHLYQRALNLLQPHVKVSFVNGLPPGTRIIIVPPDHQAEPKYMNRLHQLAMGASVRSSSMPRVPELMSTLLLTRMMYNAYRNDPQAIINAFDRPVSAQDIQGSMQMKMSGDAAMARTFRGIPTIACVKYAHISPWRPELPGCVGEVKTSSFLIRELLAGPLTDHEKRATVVACEADDLVDAATVIGLRFAGGALRRTLAQR